MENLIFFLIPGKYTTPFKDVTKNRLAFERLKEKIGDITDKWEAKNIISEMKLFNKINGGKVGRPKELKVAKNATNVPIISKNQESKEEVIEEILVEVVPQAKITKYQNFKETIGKSIF